MEKKEYSIIGKVEIGTDEYRDLIEGLTSARKEADEYRSKFWDAGSARDKAIKELEVTKRKLSSIAAFLNEAHLMDQFKLWKIKDEQETEE